MTDDESPAASAPSAASLDPELQAELGRGLNRQYAADHAALVEQMTALESRGGGDEAWNTYLGLENDLRILDLDQETRRGPGVSDSGEWERGDFRGWLRDQGLDPDRLSNEEMRRAIALLGPWYRQARGNESAARGARAQAPSAALAALAELLAVAGLAAAIPGGCRTCQSARNPRPVPRPPTPAERAARLDPGLRAAVDALRPDEILPLPPGRNAGLVDYLSRMTRWEYGIYRDAQGRYLVTRAGPSRVWPENPGDRRVFHNHPNDSGALSNGAFRNGRFVEEGDVQSSRATRPQQRSTLLGTPSRGAVRHLIPEPTTAEDFERTLRDAGVVRDPPR